MQLQLSKSDIDPLCQTLWYELRKTRDRGIHPNLVLENERQDDIARLTKLIKRLKRMLLLAGYNDYAYPLNPIVD